MLGASVLEDTATFGVWAPRCRSVDVAIEGRHPQPMRRDADGVFTAIMAWAAVTGLLVLVYWIGRRLLDRRRSAGWDRALVTTLR